MKVTVVGAGAVGASCAEYVAIKDFASEVVLIDKNAGIEEEIRTITKSRITSAIRIIKNYQFQPEPADL